MAGKIQGVQALMREWVSEATYVHCKANQVNMAMVHSTNWVCVRSNLINDHYIAGQRLLLATVQSDSIYSLMS